MKEISRTIIPIQHGHNVRTLCWHGDDLIDWFGIVRFKLDGTSSGPSVNYAYRFDHAVSSPNGKYVVLYEQRGTKGLILRAGKILREINRSFYHANVYEYPVVLFTLPDGPDVIAHCPEHYNVIEIEEVESGNRLTARTGEAADFFHSRLQVSPDTRYLLSAGWLWHPFDMMEVFDIAQAVQTPEILDQHGPVWNIKLTDDNPTEIHTAAFNGPDLIVFSGETEEDGTLHLGVYSIKANAIVSSCLVDAPVGTLMPLGNVVVSFFESPKLLDLATGEVLCRWPELSTGKQNSSIIMEPVPPIALDPANQRFAVAGLETITVVQLG